jgi:uncharacterized membrane protein
MGHRAFALIEGQRQEKLALIARSESQEFIKEVVKIMKAGNSALFFVTCRNCESPAA